MDRSCTKHEGVAEWTGAEPTPESNDLAFLGGTSAARGVALHSHAKPLRPSGAVTTGTILQLLEWQCYRCALTNRPLTPDTASLDHIVPVRNGGKHCIDNVQVLHKEVNRAKSTMTNEEFILLCREVVEHAARHHSEGGES